MMNYGGYNYYNPYNPYNQFAQQLASNQNQQNVHLKVMLVSNEEEAKATPADLNGNPTFFYNKSANKIYLKQINQDISTQPPIMTESEDYSEPKKGGKNAK